MKTTSMLERCRLFVTDPHRISNLPTFPKEVFLSAFARLDLTVIAGTVFLLISISLPALASKARSQQFVCFNNLRQIGRAFHSWGNDHNNLLPAHVSPAEGGTALTNTTYGHPIWVQFGVLSNELGTAKVLACPSDDRRVATEFSFNPTKGLFHNNFRNTALSYFIGGDAVYRNPYAGLAGDRHVQWDGYGSRCAFVGFPVAYVNLGNTTQWSNSIHDNAGHVLFMDGRVSFLDNPALSAVLPLMDDMGAIHFLVP